MQYNNKAIKAKIIIQMTDCAAGVYFLFMACTVI